MRDIRKRSESIYGRRVVMADAGPLAVDEAGLDALDPPLVGFAGLDADAIG